MADNLAEKTVVRRLVESDLEPLLVVRRRALQNAPDAFGETLEEFERGGNGPWRQHLLPNPQSFILGAFANASNNSGAKPELAGMVGCVRNKLLKMRHKGIIWGVFVEPNYRGCKLGRILMQAAIDECLLWADLEILELAVNAQNVQAISMYKQLGFANYGVETKAMKSGERYIDENLMMRILR